MNNDMLRQKTKKFIARYGSTQSWFARQLDISLSHFSLWLREEHVMADFRLEMLKNILESRGV
ncbi:MAG: hypothetical protein LBN30_00225 [Oscillospiraceae bacterium]|jgi:hypothetical protein|nr:hypothetical protein [Oscillospiraceae bacterium]